MLRQTPIMSSLIFMIICMTVCSAQIDDRQSLVNEDITTTDNPVEFENIRTVIFDKNLKAITKVTYGEHVQFICDVHSKSTMEIKWKARGKELINDNNTMLDIKSVTAEYHGEYITCEVSVHSKVTKIYGTNIKISDLAPPLISELTPSNVTVTGKENKTLTCRLEQGTPPPTVNWQFKKHGDDEFVELSATGEEFTIKDSSFEDDGQYRCIATNMKGKHNKTIDVTIQKSPVLEIKGPSIRTFEYGSTTEFTCNISGYPLPKSAWKDSEGNELKSEETEIKKHEKISKLKIKTMKKSNNYSCFAENNLGNAFESVNVTVRSPFVVHQYPENSTKVHYAVSTNIICNITTSVPMKIKWFRPKSANSSEQTEITEESKEFEIVEGVLKITSVDLERVGKYTCEASLVDDADEKIAYTTDLQIDNLAPPKLSDKNKFAVKEYTGMTLFCHIEGGVPRPTLSWQVMRHGNNTYTDLNVSTEELDVENITIKDAGNYRCVSKNPVGEWSKVTEVLVRKAPVVVIEEGSDVSVAYRSSNTYTCRVVAYPLPNVTWNDAAGSPITKMETIINEHEITSKITVDGIRVPNKYYCNATNSLGFSNSSINVAVLPPFVVHQTPEAITNVHYAASTDLVCNITASFPLRIEWYHNSTKVTSPVSANQTVLHISSMDLDDMGHYRCEATIISDETQKKEFSSDVKIDDLRAPIITYFNGASVTINKFEELSLVCKARGNPPPVVTWQHQPPSATSFNNVGTGETVCTTHASKEQTGSYKCIATNVAGVDSRDILVSCPTC